MNVEDILFNIGLKIIESWKNSNAKNKNEKVNEIFHAIQNLIGIFICWLTITQTISFKVYLQGCIDKELFEKANYRPNLILTTNYRDSVECIANYLTKSSSLYAPIETKYLHGKIEYPINVNFFKTLEINLWGKNEQKLKEILVNFDNNEEFQVKILVYQLQMIMFFSKFNFIFNKK